MSSLEAGHAAALEAIKDMPPVSATGDTITPTGEGAAATSTDATPEGQQVAGVTEQDSFTKLDPNALPPELRPYYESMQGDYTRKTQEVAPFRRLSEDTGLDADGLRQAAELYSALQDPEQLVQFHGELSTALQQAGLSPAAASQAATQHIAEVQGGGSEPTTDGWSDDPDERRIQELESRLNTFEQSQVAQREQFQREQMQMALVAEMNRQEGVVRESHPNWTQTDIDAVYELSAFYGGSLIDASNRYDAVMSDHVARILNQKGSVASDPAYAPVSPAMSGITKPTGFGDDLEAAHAAAMEAIKHLP